jgi:hypothetical protein
MNFTVQNKERISRRIGALFFFSCFVFGLLLSTPGFAQTTRICDQPPGQRVRLIQSFGHRSTSLVGPVATEDAFVALFAQDKFMNDFREVLRQACLENYEADILSAIRGGVDETTITAGTDIKWVAGRRGGRVKVVGPARYVGTKPAEAYRWEAKLGDNIYTFAAPKVCGNILLLDVRPAPVEAPPPAPPPAPAPPPPAPAPACVLTMTTVEPGRCSTVELRSDIAGTLEVQRDAAPITGVDIPARLNANEPVTLRLCDEGHYTARLTADNGAVCDAATDIIREGVTWGPFISGFVGKERRFPEEGLVEGTDGCDPIIGIQGGWGFYPSEHFEIAPAVGLKINTDNTDNTSIFADLEFNYHWDRAMVGAGIGYWDITEDETRNGSILGQFGVHLNDSDSVRVTWLNQGRIFFDAFKDDEFVQDDTGVGNNYMIWTGLRFQFAID